MKQILKVILTMVCTVWMAVACKTSRSPPRWKRNLALGLLTTALVAVTFQTIKQH